MPRCLVRAPVLALVLIAVALIAGVPSAAAVVRYASPTGVTTGNCTSPNPADPTNPPCALDYGYGVTVDGDELVIGPGDYDLGSSGLSIGKAVNVHGANGQPLPRIISSANSAVYIHNAGASLRRIAIDHSGGFQGLYVGPAASVEQLVVHSTSVQACFLDSGATLRDSVCWGSGLDGYGVYVNSVIGVFTANLRNVTAIGTGPNSYGIFVFAVNTDNHQGLVGKNVIADGTSADVGTQADNTNSEAIATMSNSNYDSQFEDPGSDGTATVTDPGTGTNQTAAPLFSDAGTGLFHEAAGSPTIDAGAVTDLLGTFDFDGDARTLGAAPDIGADEFVPSQPTPPPVSKPSSAFTLGTITRNKERGTATVTVNVPNPGELTGSGNGAKVASARAVTSKSVGAGPAQLLIKAKGKKKRKLNETGKAKLNVAITYTPTGGDPNTQSVKVRLIKR